MSAYVNIHNVKGILARAHGTLGAPVTICLLDGNNGETEVTFYTDSLPLSRRLAEAINDAVKPAEKLSARQGRIVAELVDALAHEASSLDEAKIALRAALGEYENLLEDEYQRHQDSLAESDGVDDSAYRRDLVNAGRGHLLP